MLVYSLKCTAVPYLEDWQSHHEVNPCCELDSSSNTGGEDEGCRGEGRKRKDIEYKEGCEKEAHEG